MWTMPVVPVGQAVDGLHPRRLSTACAGAVHQHTTCSVAKVSGGGAGGLRRRACGRRHPSVDGRSMTRTSPPGPSGRCAAWAARRPGRDLLRPAGRARASAAARQVPPGNRRTAWAAWRRVASGPRNRSMAGARRWAGAASCSGCRAHSWHAPRPSCVAAPGCVRNRGSAAGPAGTRVLLPVEGTGAGETRIPHGHERPPAALRPRGIGTDGVGAMT